MLLSGTTSPFRVNRELFPHKGMSNLCGKPLIEGDTSLSFRPVSFLHPFHFEHIVSHILRNLRCLLPVSSPHVDAADFLFFHAVEFPPLVNKTVVVLRPRPHGNEPTILPQRVQYSFSRDRSRPGTLPLLTFPQRTSPLRPNYIVIRRILGQENISL